MNAFEFPPPPPPPRWDPRARLKTPESERQEIKTQTAVNLFIYGFLFSRASQELQKWLYVCLHQQSPRLQLKDDKNYTKVQKQVAKAAWEITQRDTRHSVTIPWDQVLLETEGRLGDMRKILNNEYILPEDEYHLVLYRMIFLLVVKEGGQLHMPSDMPDSNKKWQRLLQKLRKKLPREKRKGTRPAVQALYDAYRGGEVREYFESPQSDPWWSHVCGYLMSNDGDLFTQSVSIPSPFLKILDDLRWALCQALTGNIFLDPEDAQDFKQNLDTVIRIYNESPHPHREVNLAAFRQKCMYGR